MIPKAPRYPSDRIDYLRAIYENEPLPLPDHPILAACADALNRSGHWALMFDASYCLVFATEDWRRTVSGLTGLGPFPLGEFYFSSIAYDVMDRWPIFGTSSDHVPQSREAFEHTFPELLSIFGGNREALRVASNPIFSDLIDGLAGGPTGLTSTYKQTSASAWGIDMGNWITHLPVRDDEGMVIGYVRFTTPAAGMSLVGTVASVGDVRHLARIQDVVTAERRPAAILFADLEASTTLSRTLSTTEYFSLARRLVRAADRCVVNAGGVVGRHLGDGVTAFFLAEAIGGESLAARSSSKQPDLFVKRCRKLQPVAIWIRIVSSSASGCTGARRCMSGSSSPLPDRR